MMAMRAPEAHLGGGHHRHSDAAWLRVSDSPPAFQAGLLARFVWLVCLVYLVGSYGLCPVSLVR